MRWFKHMTCSSRDEKLMRLRDEFGLEGYGLYWIILEAIAEQCTAENDKFFLELSPKNWRKVAEISPKKLEKFLSFSEKLGLFSVKKSQNLIKVECPNLLKYRDEYSKRKSKKSGQTPDKVRSDSRPKSIDTETETETETDIYNTNNTNVLFPRSDKNRSEPPAEKPLFQIPLVKDKNKNTQYFPVYQENLDEWQELYPAVDVESEIRKLVGWNTANPNKRKTPRGILRHIHYWLGKEQDRGNGNRAIRAGPKKERASPVALKAWNTVEECIKQNSFEIDDKAMIEAVNRMGGTSALMAWKTSEIPFRRKEFLEIFEEVKANEDT